jgi:hypothetical protein
MFGITNNSLIFVPMNKEVILTENRKGGKVSRMIVTPKLFKQIESRQNVSGFKRYSIDIYATTTKQPTSYDLQLIVIFNNIVLGNWRK